MDWITRIMVWVTLVMTLLIAFNGWITTRHFEEFQEISLAQLAAFEKYHAGEIESHKRLDKELVDLTDAVHSLNDCFEETKKKVAKIGK